MVHGPLIATCIALILFLFPVVLTMLFIKHPVKLDDVKAKLDGELYPSLSELQNDIETCFKNAKRFNQRESVIWKDEKVLHVS